MRHRSIVRTYSAILLAVVFSSCMLGKKYQRPELELPQQFNAVAYADTSSIADIEWKNFFTTPELQRLIDTGLKYNHDLLIAINRIDIAQRWVKQSRSLSYPEVNFQATGTISRPSDNSLNGISIKSFIGKSYVEYYAAQFNISWEADIWGKIRGQKEIALAEYLQTGEAAKAVQTQLVADIAHGYFNL
ncbi:MAG TPA: TolC family protein, partial [Chitinophagaceae bacterium]